MEAAALFVKATGEIPIPNSEPIHLSKPTPRLSIPLHDSYVIYHIDDLFADETIVVKEAKSNGNNAGKQQVEIRSKAVYQANFRNA